VLQAVQLVELLQEVQPGRVALQIMQVEPERKLCDGQVQLPDESSNGGIQLSQLVFVRQLTQPVIAFLQSSQLVPLMKKPSGQVQ
jgi:hypothetical protein